MTHDYPSVLSSKQCQDHWALNRIVRLRVDESEKSGVLSWFWDPWYMMYSCFYFVQFFVVGNGYTVVPMVETLLQARRSQVQFPMVSQIFHWHYPFGYTVTLGLTQHPTEMSYRDLPWEVKVASAWLKILGASTFWSPQGLPRPVQG